MAQWFKVRFAGKDGQYADQINTKNLANLTSKEPYSKDTYFKEYQKSFKDGEYNIKESAYSAFGQVIRSYFSGGMVVMAPEFDQALTSPAAVAGAKVVMKAPAAPDVGDTVVGISVDKQGNPAIGKPAAPIVTPAQLTPEQQELRRRKEKAVAITGMRLSNIKWPALWNAIEEAHLVGEERGHGIGTYDFVDLREKMRILHKALAVAGFSENVIPDLVRQLMEAKVVGKEAGNGKTIDLAQWVPMPVAYEGPLTIVLGNRGQFPLTLRVVRYDDIPETHPMKRMVNHEIEYYLFSSANPTEFKALRDEEIVDIGRSIPSRFTFTDSVSRRHLRVERRGSTFFLTDLGSSYGTTVSTGIGLRGNEAYRNGAAQNNAEADASRVEEDPVVLTRERWEMGERPQGYTSTSDLINECNRLRISLTVVDVAVWNGWLDFVRQIQAEGGVLRASEARRMAELSWRITAGLRQAIAQHRNGGVFSPEDWANGKRPEGFVPIDDLIQQARRLGLNAFEIIEKSRYEAIRVLLNKIQYERVPFTAQDVENLVALHRTVAARLEQAIAEEQEKKAYEEEIVVTPEAWGAGKRPDGYVSTTRLIHKAEDLGIDIFEVGGNEYRELIGFWRNIRQIGISLTRKDGRRMAELSQIIAERLRNAIEAENRHTSEEAEKPSDLAAEAKKLYRKVTMACHPDLFEERDKPQAEEFFKQLQQINQGVLIDQRKIQEFNVLLNRIQKWGAPKLVNMNGNGKNGGHMKELGLRNPLDADALVDLSGRHFEFEQQAAVVSLIDVYGVKARVVSADLGDIGAYHFYSPQYGLVIVVNSEMSLEIQEEGKFHEARETFWIGNGFSQPAAHVIASAEQSQRPEFLNAQGLSNYHEASLQRLRAKGRLQQIIDEHERKEKTRQFHRQAVDDANESEESTPIDIAKLAQYEGRVYSRAKELATADETQPSESHTDKSAPKADAPLTAVEVATTNNSVTSTGNSQGNMGGIDFRNLPIVTQAMTNLSAGIGNLPVSRFNMSNLDSEWQQIEQLVNSGITPSGERIKEYLQASCYNGQVDQDKKRMVICISNILRLEEERVSPTEPVLRDILIVLESGQSAKELKEVFTGIKS
jgi:hypothetical protein